MARCKQCKEKVEKPYIAGIFSFCGIEHAKDYAMSNIEKGRKKIVKEVKKVNAKKKRDFYDNDIKTRKAAAKKACHDYIKLRDAGKNCICCDKPMLKQIHAGHWLESGNNPAIRYHEDNIHSQSAYCNTFKGGDSGDYKANLIDKIGLERVTYLLDSKGVSVKYSVDDYKFIERWYKLKIKDLK